MKDEVQGHYWNNDSLLKHGNIVFISDCLKHDINSAYTFQNTIISEIKSVIPNSQRVIYYTDGCAAQF